MLVTCVALILLFFSLIYLWIKQRFATLRNYGFLHDKPSFPYGNVNDKFHLVEILSELYGKFKTRAPAFGVYFSINPAVVITDLRVVEDILINNFDSFNNRGIFYNKEDDPLSAHLLSLEDEEWRSLRHKLIPFFTGQKMKMIFRTVLNVSNYMLLGMQSEENLHMVEAKEIFAKYIIDVIGNVVFGIEMNAVDNPNSNFRKMGMRMFHFRSHILLKSVLMMTFKKFAKVLRLRLIPTDISDFFLGIVKTTVKYRIENGIKRKDILDILIAKEQTCEKELSLDEIAAQCFAFFLTGFETSSGTGAFALYSLAVHPEIQDKLREEVKAVLARHDNRITYDAMQEMKYLQMVIDETLRLYPPIFHVVRSSSIDYKIPDSDLIIPKDTFSVIPIYCIHRDAEYYPEPEKFDPERFSEENRAKRHPMTYLPFSTGSRNCIGYRFGLMQIKIALIQLLLNYKILPNEKTPKSIELDSRFPLLTSSNGLWIRFEAAK